MMRIALLGRQIIIDPPQHLALIEITRLSDGFSLKILHQSGYEVEDEDMLLISPIDAHELADTLATRQEVDRQFPLVSVIDVGQPPEHYRSIPNNVPVGFEFTAGESFTVSVIGQELAEETVVGG